MTGADPPPGREYTPPPGGGSCPTGGAIKARRPVPSVGRSTHPPGWPPASPAQIPASERSADSLYSERDQHADELERSRPWRRTSFARAAPARSGGRSVRLLTVVRAGEFARHRYSQRRKAGRE